MFRDPSKSLHDVASRHAVRRGVALTVLTGVAGGLTAFFLLPTLGVVWGVVCGVLTGGSAAILWLDRRASPDGAIPVAAGGGGMSDEGARGGERDRNKKQWIINFAITVLFFVMSAAVVTFLVALWAGPMPETTLSWRLFGGHVLVGLASACVGALLGFLLGVPRSHAATMSASSVQRAAAGGRPGEAAGDGAANDRDARDERARPGVNSNLEDVSDWLTKTLIGAGLTQLTSVPGLLRDLVGAFDTDRPGVVLGSVVVFSLGCGFLGGYIFTRIFVAGAFQTADERADGR